MYSPLLKVENYCTDLVSGIKNYFISTVSANEISSETELREETCQFLFQNRAWKE